MSGINKVILVGRLGKDPEIRTFEGGNKKASFSLATSEIYKDKDGKKIEQTEWHNIVCWHRRADFAEAYLNKGKLIYLEGSLHTRSWEDGNVKRYITEIYANKIEILSSKTEENQSTEIKVVNSPQITENIPDTDVPVFDSDDLPF